MAVASLLTSLEDMQGTPTVVNYGGGQGGSQNNDIFIEGTNSVARREDNQTDHGVGVSFTAADLSGAGEHLKVWLFITHWSATTQVQVRISSGADDDHELPTTEFPYLGGFIPVWVDVSRTPEVGGSANEASISEAGILLDIGDVQGNAQNLIIDEIHHGTSGLRWTGTGPGDMADFRTFEDTNNEGNLVTIAGVDYVYSRLEIGTTSTEADFDDSGLTIVFPDQPLVASTFMGLTFDISHASSVQALTGSVVTSGSPVGATNRPDLIVVGTSGTLDLSGDTLNGLRVLTLTSATTMTGGSISNTGQITPAGSTVSGITIADPTDDGAVLVTAATDLDNWSDITFDGAGIGGTSADAAIEIDITGAGPFTIDLDNFKFNNRVSGSVDLHFLANGNADYTINILNGGDTPTYTNDGTGTVTIVNSKDYDLVGAADGTELTILDRDVSMLDVNVGGSNANIGDAAATERAGQSFQVASTAKAERVKLRLRKVGTPTDGVTVRLVNGVPGSTLLAESVAVPGADLTTSYVEYDIDLTEKNSLTASTTYGIEIQRTGANDGSNYYQVEYDSTGTHGSGTRYNYNAGWGTASGDLWFSVMEAASDNELFHVESSSGTETYTHGGVAKEIEVLAMHTDYRAVALIDSLQTVNSSITISQSPDRTYLNP